jgi:hypothetical protein
LKRLLCANFSLGVEGAIALQPAIRANQTVEKLVLHRCNLGNEGLSVIADAILEGNTTISDTSVLTTTLSLQDVSLN